MLQRLITPKLSSQVVDLLTKKRGWSVARIAKRIHAAPDFVRRVQRGTQSFEFADIESLARACRQKPHLLVFAAMESGKMSSDQRGLYELTRTMIESHQEFTRALRRRTTRKRRAKAA